MLFEHKVKMEISGDRTALVLVDIQNDFVTDGGKYFVMIEELMKRNNVNANLETLLRSARDHGYPVFMSPHYFFPHDHKGKTRLSPMEDLAIHGGVVARASPLHTHDVPGGGDGGQARRLRGHDGLRRREGRRGGSATGDGGAGGRDDGTGQEQRAPGLHEASASAGLRRKRTRLTRLCSAETTSMVNPL